MKNIVATEKLVMLNWDWTRCSKKSSKIWSFSTNFVKGDNMSSLVLLFDYYTQPSWKYIVDWIISISDFPVPDSSSSGTLI